MRPSRLVQVAFALASLPCVAGAQEQWRTVSGPLLQSLFADKQLGDNAHYSYTFRRDGSFSGDEMGKDVRGTWRIAGDRLCWSWIKPRGSEECYQVQRSGHEVRLFRKGRIELSGSIEPLPASPNPR